MFLEKGLPENIQMLITEDDPSWISKSFDKSLFGEYVLSCIKFDSFKTIKELAKKPADFTGINIRSAASPKMKRLLLDLFPNLPK